MRSPMRIIKKILTFSLTSVLVLVTVPAVAIVSSWSTPANVSVVGGTSGEAQVTVDSTGLAIAVWLGTSGAVTVVQSSTSQSGGAWSTPVTLSAAGFDVLQPPQVKVDSTGLATAVWNIASGSGIIQASTSQSGGAWSTPVNLSATDRTVAYPKVTVDSTGLVTAIWVRSNGSHNVIQASTSQSGGPWSTPADLSEPLEDASQPQVSASSNGLATAVWRRSNGTNQIVQSSSSQSGGPWSTPANLSLPGRSALDPQVTVDSTGLATAVWKRPNGLSPSHEIIQSSSSQSGGPWSTPADLSAPGQNASSPQVTVNSTGLLTAVWRRNNGSHNIIQSSSSQSGGPWSTPANLSELGESASSPQVAVSSTGLAIAVWRRANGTDRIIQSSSSQSGGPWSTPENLSATGVYEEPQVSVSSNGLVATVWTRSDNTNQSSILTSSAAAPTITSITASSGALSVAFTAPTLNGGAPISNYKYSLDNGTTWITRSPASTSSPLVIGGVTNGTNYQVKLLAINSQGDGAASSAVSGTPVAPSPTTSAAPATTPASLTTPAATLAVTGSNLLGNWGFVVATFFVGLALVLISGARRREPHQGKG
jgi:hypothetical protein